MGLMLMDAGGYGSTAPPAYDADSEALFARMSVAPDTDRKILINALIVGLKDDGVWASLDWLAVLAAHTSQASLLNWKPGSKALTTAGTITFTVDRGWTGDGATGYLDFGEAFDSGSNLFAQDDAHAGAWCNFDSEFGGVAPHIGDINSPSPRFVVNAGRGGSIDSLRANESSTSNVGAGRTSRLGHRVGVRALSTEKKLYRAGALVDTVATTSSGVSTGNATALRQGGSTYNSDRLAAVHAGAALDATKVAALYARLNTFLTAIGGA